MKAAQYIVKERWSDGCYEARSCMGTKRGLRWGKWTVLGRYPQTEEGGKEAKKKADDAMARGGLKQVAVFYQGKTVYGRGIDWDA